MKGKEVHLAAESFIELLISVRDEPRQDKQWRLADKIRSSLGELGIALEDTPQGTAWRYKTGKDIEQSGTERGNR